MLLKPIDLFFIEAHDLSNNFLEGNLVFATTGLNLPFELILNMAVKFILFAIFRFDKGFWGFGVLGFWGFGSNCKGIRIRWRFERFECK